MAVRSGIGTTFWVRGDAEMKAKLDALPKKLTGRMVDALNAVMTEEIEEMRNRTPTLSGDLAASGRLVPAQVTTKAVSVGVRFGEGIAPYAVVQHERYWYEHDEGQARYVTSVLDESRNFIVARVARKVFAP